MRAGVNAIWAVPLAVLAAMLLIIVGDLGGVATHLRGIEFDSYQAFRPRPYEDTYAKANHSVKILDVDDAAIARFGRWPWSRAVLAKLTGELKTAGASIVVFAFPLDTPDPATPSHLASLLPANNDAARAALALIPSPDSSLATAMRGVKAVSGFTLGAKGIYPATLKADLATTGPDDPFSDTQTFNRAAGVLPQIASASAGVGALNVKADSDGRVRSLPLLFRLNDKPVPSLDAEVMRLASGKPNLTVKGEDSPTAFLGGGAVIAGIDAGSFEAPLKPDGSLQIYYAGPQAARHISVAALDSAKLAPGSLKSAIVYIAPPNDMVGTPDGLQNIADVRAEAMENILLGTALKPTSAIYAELVFLIIVGIGVVTLFARAGVLWAGVLTIVAIVGAQAFTWFLFTNAQVLLDSMNPSVALAICFAAGFATRSFEVLRAHQQLTHAFEDKLSLAAIEKIARKPELLKLAGETRLISALSCGIRGYGQLSESFANDPAGLAKLIGNVTAPLIDVAREAGGMIAHFDGESFTAYWNAPLDDPDHALHACEAANRMTVALASTNEQLAQERRFDGTPLEAIEIGIGIATGQAVAGAFGAKHYSYAVTGDCILLAARIQRLSAQYGPAVVVSADTKMAADRGFAFLEVDDIAAGPQDQAVRLYAILGNPLVRASPKFRALSTFHEHIFASLRTQQWKRARLLIEQCRKLSGASQKLYDLQVARIAWYEKNPPPADWDGAFRPVLK
jgi:adenylate cyclase